MRLSRVSAGLVVILLALNITLAGHAASSFAAPPFQQQWNTGEAFTPNFWGPLGNARVGQQEPYKEAQGGTRLVQYFDKGRMELTNGSVTYGLVASEMIKGQIQTGDGTFLAQPSPAISLAGDSDNTGPTYAMMSANRSPLMAETASTEGNQPTLSLSASGTVGTYSGRFFSDPYAVISHPDLLTHHNVPKAFCDFRAVVGLSSIGYAITEPFWSSVKIGGQQKEVLIQVYERRVLTYTPTNADPYKVEFGNIGQHYYQWRYPGM